jgi:[histone H3]-lysine4 N-trimethyltransferase ASH1L
MVLFEHLHRSDSDYNFCWFEGAKEQKCMCGAPNCRGFIGKRKALPPPSKPDILKKRKTVASKVSRVVQGRIAKVSRKTVKAYLKNGGVIKTTVVTSSRNVKTIKKTKLETTIRKPQQAASSTKGSVLGKRKRGDFAAKSGAPRPLARKDLSKRSITKSHSKTTVKRSEPTNRVHDIVRHRPRNGNVR